MKYKFVKFGSSFGMPIQSSLEEKWIASLHDPLFLFLWVGLSLFITVVLIT